MTAAPATAAATTAAPTAAPTMSAPTTAAPTTAAQTTAAPTTAAQTTAAPTTAAPATAAPTNLITSRVSFRSVRDTFTTDLLNPSSPAYIRRASMIERQLHPVFQEAFPSSFRSVKVVSFSEGSIITIMDVSFVNTSAPSNTQIGSVLINASSIVTGFDIEGSSITVNGIVSGGVIHGISLVTASCLVLLSWLLSNQQ
uniref:mucin-7-like n=1 Tax=Epinephelus lanceolatus TaxID=310571 RepID=UPI00144758BA|nr:mucin-7-like [Epinephelus lanceolatus]